MGGEVRLRPAGWRSWALVCGAAPMTLAGSVNAQQRVVQIDIAAGDASVALRELGRQTGANILFAPEVVRGISTVAIRAELPAEEAARRMLAGTSLEIVRDTTGSLLIRAGRRQSARATPDSSDRRSRPPRAPSSFPVRAPDISTKTAILADASALGELLVTATHLSAPVGRVPLSITAFTGRLLERPQTNFTLQTCDFSFTINVGEARSRGFDLQTQHQLLRGVT
jgi:iron complex outermembrane receptor protein